MGEAFEKRIHEVVARTFHVPIDHLNDDTRRGGLEEWDSLGHVNLIGALVEEFDVRIPPERALRMHTIGDVKQIMHELAAGEAAP